MSRRALAGVALAVLAGCAGNDVYAPLPDPDPVEIEETTTTTEADLTGVPLPAALGTTSTSVAMGTGPLTIVGRVEGPDGPVAGAVVQLERLVGDGIASVRVPTAADGTWNLADVLGGRYRVRAWRAPDLATARTAVLFVESGETRAIDLRLEEVGGFAIDEAIAPNPPVVDEAANLKVRVTHRRVDDDGVVRQVPASTIRVNLSGSGDWTISPTRSSFTGADGEVTFQVTCGREGAQPLFATVGDDDPLALEIPPCVDRSGTSSPTSTTTATSTSSSTSTTSTTTTTTTAIG